jgi:hypothetical protein
MAQEDVAANPRDMPHTCQFGLWFTHPSLPTSTAFLTFLKAKSRCSQSCLCTQRIGQKEMAQGLTTSGRETSQVFFFSFFFFPSLGYYLNLAYYFCYFLQPEKN